MRSFSFLRFVVMLLLLCFVISSTWTSGGVDETKKKAYMVLMDATCQEYKSKTADLFLKSMLPSREVMHTYEHALQGFSTELTTSEAEILEDHPCVNIVIADFMYQLHTTRSAYFLGIEGSFVDSIPNIKKEEDVIIGIVDTGIAPKSKSFNDSGYNNVPSRWKVDCENGTDFDPSMCNKKIISAKFFRHGYESAMRASGDEKMDVRSARDNTGHGTHTASTVAGVFVNDVSLFGFAKGTARGIAPYARLAVYKVCWIQGCFSSDILAGIDAAIGDAVDILSISLGAEGPKLNYLNDLIAISTFGAIAKGIVVSCSCGNDGPQAFSIVNTAPWIVTVGAATIDRGFPAYVYLKNESEVYKGMSIYNGASLPFTSIVYASNATHNRTLGSFCLNETLISKIVKGKIVICDIGSNRVAEKGLAVMKAGGIGMVLANTQYEELLVSANLLPTVVVGKIVGDKLKKYLMKNPKTKASFKVLGTELGVKPSPVVPAFSSRGPNSIALELLKPDIVAPGVNILAAWPRTASPTRLASDTRKVDYNILSGTSMSCPHVSGIAAIIKAWHPDWSPAAIKSAMMTTADYLDNSGTKIKDAATRRSASAFVMGAGNVNPIKSISPGVIYNLTTRDYLDFLCAMKYSRKDITAALKFKVNCSGYERLTHLNYPSFSVVFNTSLENGVGLSVTHVRNLTLVASETESMVYTSRALMDDNCVNITVIPNILNFRNQNQTLGFEVLFKATCTSPENLAFGRLEWSDEGHNHVARSPIAVTWI